MTLFLNCLSQQSFQSTSPVWRTTHPNQALPDTQHYFNPRPPCGGRHSFFLRVVFLFYISIHVPRVEDDPRPFCEPPSVCRFQSTSPVWRTTYTSPILLFGSADFNPRPPCGGRLYYSNFAANAEHFNPRPPCGGRLFPYDLVNAVSKNFNPRPPCGGRPLLTATGRLTRLFQSTSPVWRTTLRTVRPHMLYDDFNPRPPCGGRHAGCVSKNTR